MPGNKKYYLVSCPYCGEPKFKACSYVGRDGQRKFIAPHLPRKKLYDAEDAAREESTT